MRIAVTRKGSTPQTRTDDDEEADPWTDDTERHSGEGAGRRREAALVNASRLALLVVLILLWELVSDTLVPAFYISSPSAIWQQLLEWGSDETLWSNSWITVRETVAGLALGIAVGVLAGFIIGPLRLVGKVVDPFILVAYSVPRLALAPLFLVWFGVGLSMKVILAALLVFFLVFFNTVAGVRGVDRDLIDAVRLMGATRRDVTLKVVIPSAMRMVIIGIRMAIPWALIGAVVGELIASNEGLGYLVVSSSNELNAAGVFAALAVLALIATVLNVVLDRFESGRSKGGEVG